MKYPLIIPKISQPCTEDWSQMTATEKGRYCALCDKNVLDFTAMSVQEIQQALQNAQGRLCARSHPYLMKKKIVAHHHSLMPKPTYKVNPKPWMVATLLVGSMLIGSSQSISTHTSLISPVIIENTLLSQSLQKKWIPTTDDYIVLSGKLTSEFEPRGVENVKVVFLSRYREFYCYTQKDGTYELEVPKEYVQEKNVLYFDTNKANYKLQNPPKNTKGAYYIDSYKLISSQKLSQKINEKIKYSYPIAGGIGPEPIILVNGEEISAEEYYNQKSNAESCNLKTTSYYEVYGEAADLLYGKKVEHIYNGEPYSTSLVLIFDSIEIDSSSAF